MSLRNVLIGLGFAAGLLLPAAAQAAASYAVSSLNLRAGPGTGYGRIAVIPAGGRVEIYTCTAGSAWCNVNFAGYVGWASGRYLAGIAPVRRYYRPAPPPYYAPYPSTGFSFFFGAPSYNYGYHPRRAYPRYRHAPNYGYYGGRAYGGGYYGGYGGGYGRYPNFSGAPKLPSAGFGN